MSLDARILPASQTSAFVKDLDGQPREIRAIRYQRCAIGDAVHFLYHYLWGYLGLPRAQASAEGTSTRLLTTPKPSNPGGGAVIAHSARFSYALLEHHTDPTVQWQQLGSAATSLV